MKFLFLNKSQINYQNNFNLKIKNSILKWNIIKIKSILKETILSILDRKMKNSKEKMRNGHRSIKNQNNKQTNYKLIINNQINHKSDLKKEKFIKKYRN